MVFHRIERIKAIRIFKICHLTSMIGTFGCFELSPDEKQLVYLAEKKEAKKQSYLTQGIIPKADGANIVCATVCS